MRFPTLWTANHGHLHYERLRAEAAALSKGHRPPESLKQWMVEAEVLRGALVRKLNLEPVNAPLDAEFHREIVEDGYRIVAVSFQSRPGIRVTGSLYIPDGKGPFPAVLNMHGHHAKGKIYPRFQERGHVLAQNGFVVLTVDAPGSGERGKLEQVWDYHGAMRSAGLFLTGDSMMGWQVRDNQRALDLLQSLPYVDGERLGATGASGGGNQTMWLSAMDSRIKVAVPVVSTGSFEAYVGRRNCVCETLPGGLLMGEEWGVLGLIAPRPLLIINSIQDQPAFGLPAMGFTCKIVQEIYQLFGAGLSFNTRLIDLPHGYWPPMLEAMSGWMRYCLQGEGPATPATLPDWNRGLERELLCYEPGKRPVECGLGMNKEILLQAAAKRIERKSGGRKELASLTGWKKPDSAPCFVEKEATVPGMRRGIVYSPRNLPLPLIMSTTGEEEMPDELVLILSPKGKASAFVAAHWRESVASEATVASFDLPGTGELGWDLDEVYGCPLHDAARATFWLGYSLAVEWAEAISAVVRALRAMYPTARMRLIAERETVLAALIALALDDGLNALLIEYDCPNSLRDIYTLTEGSLAWIVPGFLEWGDLDTLRELASQKLSYA